MNVNRMDAARLRDVLDARGSDYARWPQTEREAAEALLLTSPEARHALAEARRLDLALASMPAMPPPSQALRRRLLAAAPSARFGWAALWRELGGLRVAGPALAGALALGVGLAAVTPLDDDDSEPDMLSWALLDAGSDEAVP